MKTNNEYIEMLLSKSYEEIVNLLNNDEKLKVEIQNFTAKVNSFTVEILNELMVGEFKKRLEEKLDSDLNQQQIWDYVTEKIIIRFFTNNI